MKSCILIFLMFIFTKGYCLNDSVLFKINSIEVFNNQVIQIDFTVSNNTIDTLVFIKEFYSQGIENNIMAHPINSNSPNIFYFRNSNRNEFEGSGKLELNYDKMPFFEKLLPSESKNYTSINLLPYENGGNWSVTGRLNLIILSNLRNIFSKNYPLLNLEDYFKNNDWIKIQNEFMHSNSLYNKITDEFSIIIFSK